MPAVDLKRLQTQIDGLLWRFDRPEEFLVELKSIFSYYADRVQRPGHLASQKQILQAYHLSPLVMRQLENGLRAQALKEPAQTLNLVDLLAEEEKWEPRSLAATLLGYLPLDFEEEITSRLLAWSGKTADKKILKPLLDKSCARLSTEQPEAWLTILKNWSLSQQKSDHRLMLLGVQNLLSDRHYENLPPIYDMVAKSLRLFPQALQETLLEVMEALIATSSAESAYFVRQTIRLGSAGTAPALLRKIIALFPAPYQRSLYDEMRTSPPA